jgi:hypothetical protein
MASYTTGGEQNVNRLINANASFTRQRDDARRTKQLAEERLNLVKKDSECDDIAMIDLFIVSGESMLFFLHLTIKIAISLIFFYQGRWRRRRLFQWRGNSVNMLRKCVKPRKRGKFWRVRMERLQRM